MKLKATLVLVVALAGGAGAFTWRAVRPGADAAAVREPELQWLQREFALSDDVVLRIADLHRAYTAECESMCVALEKSDAEVQRLMVGEKRMTPKLEAALDRSSKLMAACQRRMVEHFYTVAKEMPPPAGERYLALMTPVAAQPGHGWMKVSP